MLWKLLENALASTLSRAMLDVRVERMLDRVQHLGVMPEAELQKLRDDVRARLEQVEGEGREMRQIVERVMREALERFRGGRP